METGIKSSFIPQGPIQPMRTEVHRGGRGGFDLFVVLALVIFVASATLAAGVFLYVQFLQKSATSKVDQLERAKAAFEPSLVQDLTRLDDRMRASDTILAGHLAPTTLFHLLEQLTLQTVSFQSLDLKTGEGGDLSVQMKGVAQSVNSIALQADLLSKSGEITNPIFTNINRQLNGVNFDFSAKINPSAMKYETLMSAPPPQASPQNIGAQPAGTPFGAEGTSTTP